MMSDLSRHKKYSKESHNTVGAAYNLSKGVQGHPWIGNKYEVSYIRCCLGSTKNLKEVVSGGAGL